MPTADVTYDIPHLEDFIETRYRRKKKDVERNRGSTRMNLSRGVEKDREMLVEFSFNSNEERKKRKVLRTRSILDNLDIGGAVI